MESSVEGGSRNEKKVVTEISFQSSSLDSIKLTNVNWIDKSFGLDWFYLQ